MAWLKDLRYLDDAAFARDRAAGLGDDEVARCRTLAERRARGSPAALDDRGKSRLSRFLLGRGFSGRAVSAALGVYVDDAEDR